MPTICVKRNNSGHKNLVSKMDVSASPKFDSSSDSFQSKSKRTQRVKRAPSMLPAEACTYSTKSSTNSAAKSSAKPLLSSSCSRSTARSTRTKEARSNATISASAQRLVTSLYEDSLAASQKSFRSAAAAAPSSLTASRDERSTVVDAEKSAVLATAVSESKDILTSEQSERNDHAPVGDWPIDVESEEAQMYVESGNTRNNDIDANSSTVQNANDGDQAAPERSLSVQNKTIDESEKDSEQDVGCKEEMIEPKPQENESEQESREQTTPEKGFEQSTTTELRKSFIDQSEQIAGQSQEVETNQPVEQSGEVEAIEKSEEIQVDSEQSKKDENNSAVEPSDKSEQSEKVEINSVTEQSQAAEETEAIAQCNDAVDIEPPLVEQPTKVVVSTVKPPPMPNKRSQRAQPQWHFAKTPFAYIENDDAEQPLLFSVHQTRDKKQNVAELRALQIVGVHERHVRYDDDDRAIEEDWIGLKANAASPSNTTTLVVDSDGCFGARDTSENIFVPGQIHFVESLDRLRVKIQHSANAARVKWLN